MIKTNSRIILSAENLTKSYDKKTVLQSISLSLSKGNILAIIGQSGSGKTTLIKILAGLLTPDAGQVYFNGKKLEGPEEKLVPGHKEIRLVHQDFKLHHRMTVEENLKNALIEYVEDYKQERTEELLDLCRITNIKGQYVHEISGGEKQRVAIAMALATEPEVLLFDEPFSNLDFRTKTNLLHEIEAIAKTTNTSVILITHDSRDAMEIADTILVLNKGRIIRKGSPVEVYQQPKFEHVANLLGLYSSFTQSELSLLFEETSYPSINRTSGIWAEDVLLHKPDGVPGRVRKVVFSGPFNKLLIAGNNIQIWAYDYSRKVRVKDKIKFSVRKENIFYFE